ncbi:MAG: heavy metal-associated domain-containing protein [Chloroherpetonaceae bacterium]|nr:heavy metal-associated domain-containing protein [Chloroherpetonaceae bacterium]
MNNFVLKTVTSLAIFITLIVVGCKEEKIETIEVKVSGMVCNSCEKAIETKVASLDGVKSVKATQPEGKVTIELSSNTNLETVTKEIEGLHYKVEGTPIIKSSL